jgi:transcriptional regulator with XRE-family HTH domain
MIFLVFMVVCSNFFSMLTGPQIRAARGLIGWSIATLADKAGVGYQTVHRAETAEGVPSTTATNLFAIQRALEAAGVVFLDEHEHRDGGVGVRLRRQ